MPYGNALLANGGKSGWVTVSVSPGARPPLSLLKDWIDESYRAQAPKRLLAQLPARR